VGCASHGGGGNDPPFGVPVNRKKAE